MCNMNECPKCNSDYVYEEGDDEWSMIECGDCGYSIKRKNYDKCISAWNKLKRKNQKPTTLSELKAMK
jgi:DNA-directed RNA polymerase subunit M/transcription elongation factor TFIIS